VFNIKYSSVEHWEDLFIQNTGDYYMLSTVEKIIYTKYWGLLYVAYFQIFYVNKYSHSVQQEVFLSILYK
jgi:hypothetical protein